MTVSVKPAQIPFGLRRHIHRTEPGEFYNVGRTGEREPAQFWEVRCLNCRRKHYYSEKPAYFCSPECEKSFLGQIESPIPKNLIENTTS